MMAGQADLALAALASGGRKNRAGGERDEGIPEHPGVVQQSRSQELTLIDICSIGDELRLSRFMESR